jgi:3-oxoacyl-[acyl-carrier-protein] synthase II
LIPVVVSGVGFVHPHGSCLEDLGRAIGLGLPPPGPRIEELDYEAFFPGESPRVKRMDRVGRYASCAALLALRHAGLALPAAAPETIAVVGGTMFGGLEACVQFHAELTRMGPDAVTASLFPNTAHNVACAQVAISLGVEGPVFAIASGLAAGLEAVIWGCRLLRSRRAEMVLAGGFDGWSEALEAALRFMDALAPDGAPGDPGLWPAEGACFLVLESRERCLERGGRPLAEILGYAQASAGGSRRERGAAALGGALQQALSAAGDVRPRTLCLGVQGLRRYDRQIAGAYGALGGNGAAGPIRFACKEVLGETFGASGPFAVAAVLAAGEAVLPGPVIVDALAWGGAAAALVLQPLH